MLEYLGVKNTRKSTSKYIIFQKNSKKKVWLLGGFEPAAFLCQEFIKVENAKSIGKKYTQIHAKVLAYMLI